MKVPSLPNLIVCAISPQAIVRHYVLAAVFVSVLCGAASAQSAPAAPPLTLLPAVEVSHTTAQDKTFSLEHSPDLLRWITVAPPVFGDDEDFSHLISTSEGKGKGFYRLKVETFPEEGDSRWSLTGSRILLNTAGGVCRMNFDENAAGTMTRDAAVTTFTWQWHRDGLDTGIAAITWPDGTVETIAMEFTGNNSGAFSSQRTTDGLPGGAVSGTFRDEAGPGLLPTVPAALGNALVTFSSTGRAVSVKVSADGTAGITSPAGRASYDCSYAVTGPSTAELKMRGSNGTTESWSLTFAGPACGTYAWKSELKGVPRRQSSGAFTIAPQ